MRGITSVSRYISLGVALEIVLTRSFSWSSLMFGTTSSQLCMYSDARLMAVQSAVISARVLAEMNVTWGWAEIMSTMIHEAFSKLA